MCDKHKFCLNSILFCMLLRGVLGADGYTNSSTQSINHYLTTFQSSELPLPQLPGFNSTHVTSGPIVLINKRTIFVSNLNYDGTNKSSHFWAGNGLPSAKGYLMPDENNKTDVLKEYSGANIYIIFPGNLTLDDIDYFGIWSNKTQNDIGYVVFDGINKSEIREDISNDLYVTEDGRKILRVPKCCPLHYERHAEGCVSSTIQNNLSISVYESNMTHINVEGYMAPDKYEIKPYIYPIDCESNEVIIPIEEGDVHGLLFNSSLIVNNVLLKSVLPHGRFCVDHINNSSKDAVLICFSPHAHKTEEAGMPNLYLAVLVISAICFAICSICYWFILRVKEVHKQCFVAYSTSMCLTFVSLICLQTMNTESGCVAFGSFFVFFTMLSFSWLAILCADLIYIILYFEEDTRMFQRIYWFIGISSGISLTVLLLSLFVNSESRPNVPQTFIKSYTRESCYFEGSNIAIFFVPIGILVLICFASLGAVFYQMRKNEEEYKNNYFWLANRTTYKFIYRSYIIIVLIASFWLVEVIFNLLALDLRIKELSFDLIEASLGIVTMCIFILNKYTRKEILMKLNKKEQKKPQLTEEMLELNGFNLPKTPDSDKDSFFEDAPQSAKDK